MGDSKVDNKTLFRWRFICLFICWGAFYGIYSLSGDYAASLDDVPSFYFPFEKAIPFLSCTIYPYMSSGLFFIYVFFICRTRKELSVLSKRILFVTAVSGICFVLFPMKQSFTRPDTANLLFTFLDRCDTPFNQAPSLHVSYAFIFWSAVGSSRFKRLLRGWLCLMVVSTLTVYQHHLMDVVSAFALGCVASFLFPYLRERNRQIAKVYLFASAFVLGAALFATGHSVLYCIALLWCAVTLLLIARAYYQSDAGFLKNNRGGVSIGKYILYLPYILTYWVMWIFSRNTIVEIAPGVYVGGRISQCRAKSFSKFSEVTVFDLSAELPENLYFRKRANYHCVPLLDIGSVPEAYVKEIVPAILSVLAKRDATGKIYIHCTMGRYRSHLIGELLLHEFRKQYKTEIR